MRKRRRSTRKPDPQATLPTSPVPPESPLAAGVRVSSPAPAGRPLAPLALLGWVAVAAVFLLALLLAWREVSEVDLGFHLRAGQWILEHRQWPQDDPFTYTVNDHAYIDLHWLYQVALFGLYQLGGSLALVLAHAAGILGAFALAGLIAWRRFRSPPALAGLLFLGVLAAELRFMIRPEVASWVLLGLTVLLLERHAAGRRSPLWVLPFLIVLWVNVQGLFILGWLAIGCYFVGLWIEQRRPDRRLALWGGASVVAAFCNPYLHRGVLFPLTLFTRLSKENVFGQTISEFTSPWRLGLSSTQPFYPRLTLWAYYLLAVVVIVGVLLTWRKHRPYTYLLALAFWVLSIQAIRNVPLFVLVALPVLATCLSAIPPRAVPGKSRRRAARASSWRLLWERVAALPWPWVGTVVLLSAVAAIGLRVVTNAYYIADRRSERFGSGLSGAALPIEAVSFLKEKGVQGRILNHLNYGGYLMWQWPEPVFIDGRLEVMGEAFYEEYLTASTEQALLTLLDRYQADVVIFPYLVAPSWVQQMRAAPHWRLVYADGQAAVYLRNGTNPDVPALALPTTTPAGRPIPVPDEMRAAVLDAPRAVGLLPWLEGFWQLQSFPQEEMNRGIFHYYLDQWDAAESYYLDAIEGSQGRYYEVYSNLGAVYFKEKRYDEAKRCYQVVLDDQPGNQLAQDRIEAMGR
jgi:hypothetical protein